MVDEELGARLSLKDRPQFSAEAARAARDVDHLGDSAARSGTMAAGATRQYGAFGNGLRTFGAFAVRGLAVAGTAAGVAGGAFALMGLKADAAREQAEISFTTLIGSGQKAKKFYVDLQHFAANTPFELPGLTDAARQLLGAGAASKDVLPTLTAWGDTAGALGISQDAFNRALLATTQSMANGKIQAGDMLQITQAGIPIWSLLAKSQGTSVAAVRKMSEAGELLTKDALPKLYKQMEKDYGGAMAKQALTLTGLWSTFQDNLRAVAMALIGPFRDGLKGGLTALSEFTGRVSKWAAHLGKMMPVLRETFKYGLRTDDFGDFGKALSIALTGSEKYTHTFGRIADMVRRAAKVITGVIIPAMQDFAHMAGPVATLLNPIKLFLGLIMLMSNHTTFFRTVLLVLITVYAAYKAASLGIIVVDKARAAVTWLNVVRTKEATGATLAQRAAMLVVRGAVLAWTAAQWLLNAAMTANPIGIIIGLLVALGVGFVLLWKRSETFRAIVTGVFHAVAGAAKYVYNWIKENWPYLVGMLGGPFGVAVVWIIKHWDGVVGFFKAIPGKVGNALKAVGNAILAPFEWAFNKVADAWNATAGKIHFHVPGWVPGIGGKGWSMPTIGHVGVSQYAHDTSKGYVYNSGSQVPGMHTGGSTMRDAYINLQPSEEIVSLPNGTTVVPLEHDTVRDLLAARGDGGSDGPTVIQLVVDGKVLAEAVHGNTRDKVARQ